LLLVLTALMRARLLVVSLAFVGVVLHPAGANASDLGAVTGGITTHIVAPGETLTGLAARFGVDAATIASDNHLAAGRPLEAGRELVIDNRHIAPAISAGEIVINVPQRMLFYREEDRVLAYPIAVGRTTWQTPQGPFSVVRKEQDPAWHVPESIRAESLRKGQLLPLVVPPGPRNPLGRFWIGLSLTGIGVHGTPFPSSIYQTATHGCIRLQADQIEDLYGRVTMATRGRIVYEPVLLTVDDRGEVYFEVHRDVYRRAPMSASQQARKLAARLALADRINWTLAEQEIELHAGIARRISSTAD
jgi:L,D-transpeptidase ErfK/SrfK